MDKISLDVMSIAVRAGSFEKEMTFREIDRLMEEISSNFYDLTFAVNDIYNGSAPVGDGFMLAVARGTVAGMTSVNKFGRAVDGVQTAGSDIWDRADSAATQNTWLAPTAARVHSITGTVNDTLAGTHAQKVQVFGLTSWDADEVSETVEMAGAGGVNTTNSFVIIHRMKVVQWGSSATNGLIQATAATDATVTAEINADEGQTQMAIYGVPSTQKAYMTRYYASINKAVAAANADVSLLVNPVPDDDTTVWQVKHTNGLDTTGTSYLNHEFDPPFVIAGPAIIKLRGVSSAADLDMSGGCDLVLVDN